MDEEGSWFLACRPVPGWPEEVVSGYRALAAQEAKYSQVALEEIPGAFEPWFRMLALLDEALRREHDFAGQADPHGIAWLLRLRLATVAAGTAKMVLDAALVGYYVQGFALVRHMLETWRQMVYSSIRPEDATRWYPGPDGTPPREPGENKIINTLAKHAPDKAVFGTVQDLIRKLNKAAHPSGLALGQTDAGREKFSQLGGNFLRPLCVNLVDWGSFATALIVTEVRKEVPVTEAWVAGWRAAAKARRAWLETEYRSDPTERSHPE